MSLAGARGCGELDPEPAAGVLEDVGWDVAAALARLSAERHAGIAATLPDGSAHEHVYRQQQAEYAGAALAESESDTDDEPPGEEAPRQVGMGQGPARERGGRRPRRSRGDVAHGMRLLEGLAAMVGVEHPDFREALRLHQMISDFAQQQDEADFQSALRRSAEEAYSGGFNVPPANEATLAATTRTSTVKAGCEHDTCAVCLLNYDVGDVLRTLRCGHRFHLGCVDQWLARSGQCPVCKAPTG